MSEYMSKMSELMSEEDAGELKRRFQREAADLAPGHQWVLIDFSSLAAALNWLNAAPRQSAGEVCATLRNNGTVGLLTVFPPTLSPLKQWFSQDFPSANNAVTFLNTNPTKSAGEVSATIRNNGTVGLIFLA
jgi:hypothetical protein